ncbi:SUKH-3 domain-containing protein [Streptomyces sp. NPDC002838]|uniref:SUKH-3 domain-containing protein n=1 Tax=Streptomyces sp. NPDC002838 TaxID=3154436 RepID=UPI00331D3FB2
MVRFESLRPDTLAALSVSGWRPHRCVSISHWIEPLADEGYRVHPLAEEVLATMGGLTIEPTNRVGPNFSNDEPFAFDPLAAGAGQRDMAVEVESVLGGTYFPIGEWLSYSSVFMESEGRVIATGLGWIWELGPTFEEALELAVFADRPLICLHSDPGLDPWPPISSR